MNKYPKEKNFLDRTHTCRVPEHDPRSQTLKFFKTSLAPPPTSHIVISPIFVPTETGKHMQLFAHQKADWNGVFNGLDFDPKQQDFKQEKIYG